MTPEQRPSVVLSCRSVDDLRLNMAARGGDHMKVTKKAEAPSLKMNSGNYFLAAIHVLALVVSLAVHPIFDTSAARALP